MDGRLMFPRKEDGSYICATRVPSGQNVGRTISLETFEVRRPPSSSVFTSSPPPTALPPPVVTYLIETGAKNGVAATFAGGV